MEPPGKMTFKFGTWVRLRRWRSLTVRGNGRTARWCRAGWTMIELILMTAIIATLAALGAPRLQAALDKANVAGAIGDIHALQLELMQYEAEYGAPPASLAAIARSNLLDPWDNTYQYLNLVGAPGGGGGGGGGGPGGQPRKDRFLVPINSSFDLYSMGKDGLSTPPLTAKGSRDDVVRAMDGGFIGLAEDF